MLTFGAFWLAATILRFLEGDIGQTGRNSRFLCAFELIGLILPVLMRAFFAFRYELESKLLCLLP